MWVMLLKMLLGGGVMTKTFRRVAKALGKPVDGCSWCLPQSCAYLLAKRERGREIGEKVLMEHIYKYTQKCKYVYIYIHINIHIYIYIYIHI